MEEETSGVGLAFAVDLRDRFLWRLDDRSSDESVKRSLHDIPFAFSLVQRTTEFYSFPNGTINE